MKSASTLDYPQLHSKSLSELLQILNGQWLEQKSEEGISPDSHTHLCKGASVEQIAGLRLRIGDLTRLGGSKTSLEFPDDYLEFLRISNGFYLHEKDSKDGRAELDDLLYTTEQVEREDRMIDLTLFKANPLLHPLPENIQTKFTWPRISGVDIGPAGDEGNLWLFGPGELKKIENEIERVYPELVNQEKQIIDDLITQLYGNRDRMREHQWTILEFYHWSPVLKLHLSFRAYLEQKIYASFHGEDDRD